MFVRRFLFVVVIATLAPNVGWAQRDLTEIPPPDPKAEQQAMSVHESAAVNLFAADPQISKPIQINFDSTGALWVASSEVYPQIRPGERADDKIVVLRDLDGDGQAEDRTVFADGLLIPTGVVPDSPHSCYVAESTQLIHLDDTDGDGRADQRRVVFSGFGTEDTHHLVHTLRWGPDGCLYFNQSIYIHSHIETAFGTRHLDGGGVWRYRPSTGELEVFCQGFVNPWGHVLDSIGESFVTDGAFFEGINYVFPHAVFVTSPGATRWLSGLNPGSPKHCGLEILSGTHIPPAWQGELLTNDFRSHRVCRFTVRPQGSGYVSRQQPELLTSSNVAFRPIDVRMGPDGAVYVADWYNPIIQHGEVDFRDERRDRSHGRIWRISFPDRPLDHWPDFHASTTVDLITMLEDDALAVRQFARQQLWRRAAERPSAVAAAMQQWRDQVDLAADRRASRSLEQLWLNEVLEQCILDDATTAIEAAAQADNRTLRTALRSIWRNRVRLPPDGAEREQIEALVVSRTVDLDPRPRLEAVVSNGELRSLPAARRTIAASEMSMDENLDFAIWQALRAQAEFWVPASLNGEIDWRGRESALAFAVQAVGTSDAAEIVARLVEQGDLTEPASTQLLAAVAESGAASQLGRVLETFVRDADYQANSRRLLPLIERTERDGTIPSGAAEALQKLVPNAESLRADVDWAQTAARAAAAWRVNALASQFITALKDADPTMRPSLITAIGSFTTPTAQTTIDELAAQGDDPSRIAATSALLATRPQAALAPLVELLQNSSTNDAAADLTAKVLRQKGLPGQLAKRLAAAELPADFARQVLRRVRSGGGHESLEAAIRQAGSLDDAAWKLTPAWSAKILEAAQKHGSPQRGEQVYRRPELQCIVCHAIGPAGGVVGPNLISLGGSAQPDYILESLIDPSAKLKEGYSTLTVVTDEGKVVNGIVIGESVDSLRMRLADASEIEIDKAAIEQQSVGKSLMPAGLLDELTAAELSDLVAFMAALGREPEFTVSTTPIVRSLETLNYTDEANHRLNRTSIDTVASGDPAMTWRPLTSRVSGEIPLDELDQFKQHRQTPPTSFIRFAVLLPTAGTAEIELPTDGIESWIDRTPTPVWDLSSLQLDRGVHQIVLAIDRSSPAGPLVIQVSGDATPVSE